MFDVFAFHGALRGLCGLDHARIGPDRQNLCQTDMFVPGTGFIQEHKHKCAQERRLLDGSVHW